MKKNKAFTLAEVLITLGIIGIVAEMTIPTLMTTTQERELKAAWRKNYSIISQASALVKQENGFTFVGLCEDNDYNCFRDKFQEKLKYIKSCDSNASQGICWHLDNQFYTSKGVPRTWYPEYSGLVLADGALVSLNFYSKACNTTWTDDTAASCGGMIIDVNGFKKPNKVGRDLFQLKVLSDRIVPYGITGFNPATNKCDASSAYQWNCSYDYLYNQ